jgi:hypothetical protein
MPLFDLFKKPNKKGPEREQDNKAAETSSDNPFASPEMQKKRYEAAMDFLKFFQEKTPLLNGRPHAGTVLSIAARWLGQVCIGQSTNRMLPPAPSFFRKKSTKHIPSC